MAARDLAKRAGLMSTFGLPPLGFIIGSLIFLQVNLSGQSLAALSEKYPLNDIAQFVPVLNIILVS